MIDLKLTVAGKRIVLRKSDDPDQYFDSTWVGTITAVNGKRIQFDRRLADGTTESRFMLEKTVAAVCDTEEEVKRLLGFNDGAFLAISNLREQLDRDFVQLMKGTK